MGTRDERRARVHADLLAAARSTIEEGGAQALTMRGLASRVGYSAPVVYQHFADRQAVLDAVASEGFDLLARRLADAVAARDEPGDLSGPQVITLAYLLCAQEYPRLMDLMHSPQVTPEVRARAAEGVVGVARSTVRDWAAARGVDLGAAEAEADALWALGQGLTTIARITPQEDGPGCALAAVDALTRGWEQQADRA